MTPLGPVQILVVDDDSKVRTLLRRCFEQEGYVVFEAENGSDMFDRLKRSKIDLITLDLNLNGEDGLSLAREIRKKLLVPIVMVTGKGDIIDKVVGLEVGADDYISKPFHVREIIARIRSVLRRSQSVPQSSDNSVTVPDKSKIAFGNYVIDLKKRELKNSSEEIIPLTTGEFQLLDVFIRHPGQVLSRDQIMDKIKGHNWSPLDRSVDNQVARLRKKFAKDPAANDLVETIRGAGYCFKETVKYL